MILLHCLTFFFSFFLAANNIETLASKVQEKLKANTPTEGNYFLKACVRYFLSNFCFSPNDSPSKTIKDVFYCIQKTLFVLEIFKFLYFRLPLLFSLAAITLKLDRRQILKFMTSTV